MESFKPFGFQFVLILVNTSNVHFDQVLETPTERPVLSPTSKLFTSTLSPIVYVVPWIVVYPESSITPVPYDTTFLTLRSWVTYGGTRSRVPPTVSNTVTKSAPRVLSPSWRLPRPFIPPRTNRSPLPLWPNFVWDPTTIPYLHILEPRRHRTSSKDVSYYLSPRLLTLISEPIVRNHLSKPLLFFFLELLSLLWPPPPAIKIFGSISVWISKNKSNDPLLLLGPFLNLVFNHLLSTCIQTHIGLRIRHWVLLLLFLLSFTMSS